MISSAGTDGRDHQLLHGADFFLAHDRHGGQRKRHQRDDVDDHARDEIIAAAQIGIEPHAGSRCDLRRRHGAPVLPTPWSPTIIFEFCCCLHHLIRIAADALRWRSRRRSTPYWNWFRRAAPARRSIRPRSTSWREAGQHAHHGVHLAAIHHASAWRARPGGSGQDEAAGAFEFGQQLAALRRAVLIHPRDLARCPRPGSRRSRRSSTESAAA